MNTKLATYLAAVGEPYPHALDRDYPAILEKIADLWGTDAGEAYFAELSIADTERRQGFPPDVARDILRLSLAHDRWHALPQEEDDPWADEPPMDESERAAFLDTLERRGERFAPETFFQRVERGETREVLLFLRAGMDVDTRRADEWTPLLVALFNGREETAMLLLSKGANVRAADRYGYQPLHWAALNGYERATRFILDKGADPNAMTVYGFTPLLQAAARGHLAIVQMLVERGALVNQAGHEGFTPLHKASANGHLQVVRFLLARGAQRTACTAAGATPADLARAGRHAEVVRLLES